MTTNRVDPGFGHWLAGFVDGEGCFTIISSRRQASLICRFSLGLRSDDAPILREACERTGLGRVYRAGDGRMATWIVATQADLIALVELFEKYPLRAKKKRDFEIWARAVRLWVGRPSRVGVRGDDSTLTRVSDLAVEEIRTRNARGERQIDLAAEFGVSQGHISKIVTGLARGEAKAPPWAEMRNLQRELREVRRYAGSTC